MAKAKVIVFLCIIGLLALSSWVMTRRARRILSQSLGRDVRAGEETSLRAWMAVPDATLQAAHDELRANPTAHVLEVLESVKHPRYGEHEPFDTHNSIR